MRPITLLLTLLLLASLVGSWAYAQYQRTIIGIKMADRGLVGGHRGENEVPSEAPAPDGSEENSNDLAIVKKNLAFFKEQVELLRKENENLSSSVRKLSEQLAAGGGLEGPDGQSSGISPESLVRDVELIRELKFDPPPTFVRVPVTELEAKIRTALRARLTDEQAASQARAARAIGLTQEEFDTIDALTGLILEQAGGHFEPTTHELFIDEAADFEKRPDLKGKLVKEIAVALLQQHHPGIGLDPLHPLNNDQAAAARAFMLGDAVATKIHFGVVDALNNDYGRSQPAVLPAAFSAAPLYLRQLFLFPYMMGSSFAQELSQNDGPKSLDRIYDRLPTSTTEVLHPELYTASPPFVPESVLYDDVFVRDAAPYADNVLGEFALYILFKARLPEDQAFEAAKGWLGDRYVCYPGAEGPAGDHVHWRTLWQTEQDAADFLKAARTVWLHRYAIPSNPRYELPDGSTVVDDPTRQIRLRLGPDKKSVTLVDSPEAAWADALEAVLIAK
ncbi:MAG: hypothetical protein ACKV19_22045 [Verrucomicrobiales bacterium]